MTAQPVENPVDEKPDAAVEPDAVHTPNPEPEIEGLPDEVPQSAEVVTLRSRGGQGVLSIDPNQEKWLPAQVTGLRSIGVEVEGPDAVPHAYVWQFLHMCQKTDLDPWMREAYLITHGKRWEKDNGEVVDNRKFTLVTGIDGFRKKAEDTGQYVGQIGPQWAGDDGVWKDFWNPKWGPPVVARVGILRKGFDTPVWGVAMYDEFVAMVDEYVEVEKQGRNGSTYTKREKTGVKRPNEMWAKMGANQLAKCAEAQGFRKAFPRTMAGMYEASEMARAQADYEQQQADEQQRAQRRRLVAAHAAAKAPQAPDQASAQSSGPVTVGEVAQDVVEGHVDAPTDTAPTETPAGAEAAGGGGLTVQSPEAPALLREELEWIASVMKPDHEPEAGARLLAARRMSAVKRDLDAFTAEDLLAVVAAHRAPAAARLAQTDPGAAAAYRDVEASEVINLREDILGEGDDAPAEPPTNVDPHSRHEYVDTGGVCGVEGCGRFEDELPHPRVKGADDQTQGLPSEH